MLLTWLALLSMVLGGLPALAGPGQDMHASSSQQAQPGQETGQLPGAPCSEQEEPPAKPRRGSSTTLAKAADTTPAVFARGSSALIIAALLAAPPQHQPVIADAPATPLPAPPGLRMQRGQAPPLA